VIITHHHIAYNFNVMLNNKLLTPFMIFAVYDVSPKFTWLRGFLATARLLLLLTGARGFTIPGWDGKFRTGEWKSKTAGSKVPGFPPVKYRHASKSAY